MTNPPKNQQVRTSVYLDQETRERLDEFCSRTKRNISGAIEFFVLEGLDRYQMTQGQFFPVPPGVTTE